VSAAAKDARSDAIIAALVSMGGWGNGDVLQIDFSIPLKDRVALSHDRCRTSTSKRIARRTGRPTAWRCSSKRRRPEPM
jgi:hypothetical protein